MPKTPNSAVQIRAKIQSLQRDVVYQRRYIAGLQNADLFPAAFLSLAHLEKTLMMFQNALDPSQSKIKTEASRRHSAA